MKSKVIIIGGPTASGKSNLAINLAKSINVEIISCDSMQVYKEMNIGTAKPSIDDRKIVKHHMIDIVSPNEEFNVVKYKKMASIIIEEVLKRGNIPIIVGGTGLYVESLVYNIEFSNCGCDEEYRKSLINISNLEGNEKLYNMLKEIDFEFASQISINDTKRIIRGLEIFKSTGKNMTYHNKKSRENEVPYDYYLFGIMHNRDKLYAKIDNRVDEMINNGLVEEVKNIYQKYNNFPTAMQGLGYKEVVEYLNNNCTFEEMVNKIKQETRRYAKRQITWFKRYKNMIWFDANNMSIEDMKNEIINKIS